MEPVAEVVAVVVKSRRPPGGSFRQQRMTSWAPVMTPLKIIVIFLAIGVCFIPTGTSIYKSSNAVFEQRIVYDGSNPEDVQCQIDNVNQGRKCDVSFTVNQDVRGPLLVYYELNNYYQNHRRYVTSYSSSQLLGADIGASDATVSTACNPLTKNGSLSLNPCGLIANSFFTDMISLKSSTVFGSVLDESLISEASERSQKFKQVIGFKSQEVSSVTADCAASGLPVGCKGYKDPKTGLSYLFYYPNDQNVQYLYESYPKQISPLVGITDEHFIVWMRTSALPKFRKLYGRINSNFKKGDVITFQVEANFEVRSFNADKAIIITSGGQFGAKNPSLGIAYIVVGSLSLFLAVVFGMKQLIRPRPLGSPKSLQWVAQTRPI